MTQEQFDKLPKFAQQEILDLKLKIRNLSETLDSLTSDKKESRISQWISYPDTKIFIKDTLDITVDLSGTIHRQGADIPFRSDISLRLECMKKNGDVRPVLALNATKDILVSPRSSNTLHIYTETV